MQLKATFMNVLVDAGEIPSTFGGCGRKKAAAPKTVKIWKRGSIIIPAEMVSDLGLGSGGAFTVRRTKAGVALKKVVE